MIYTMTPFAPDMNLGRAYNEAMALLPEGAWACFLDHDAAWTTRQWYHQVREAIAAAPDAGAFTAVTNRIAAPWQKAAPGPDFPCSHGGGPLRKCRIPWTDHHDVAEHRRFGSERMQVRTLLDITDTKGFGGVVMVVSKATWRRAGGFVDGMLCVDHHMHFAIRAAGLRVFLIEGLYVYHWRRANGDDLPKDTPRAKDCPCRGAEIMPTERRILP